MNDYEPLHFFTAGMDKEDNGSIVDQKTIASRLVVIDLCGGLNEGDEDEERATPMVQVQPEADFRRAASKEGTRGQQQIAARNRMPNKDPQQWHLRVLKEPELSEAMIGTNKRPESPPAGRAVPTVLSEEATSLHH
ncbi:hypothetical protein DOTSEDRAFT_22981 [Dothistroma septosporum NZE10]|uniref:Uncharacterized protein n=1 Tax=Dothistroma septosporum (strain NZE10 / CBS 128990) TaxID=675120 RepID=N1PN58_DOTSN|nr:hypothetical protein DOTSEDRAFT_22981 [Dothistroma septosporum NZE10]